ncbi:outer membrane protein assembly factor BamA [Acidimangrovimonas pyrenivorans]|uniref:Outer membrane protein assembly factor BamA n=1 Tax=Acidimangrovimonas pyrenivorans TaxID=2030798 RepID=A0ABV7AE34_9RHOB
MQVTSGRKTTRNARRGALLNTLVISFFLVLAMVCAWGVTPAQAQAQDYRFTAVRVEGNQRIEPGTILSYAGIKRGATISGADLNDAYQRIAQSGLFQQVDLVPQGNTLVIKVKEYPIINVINFEGNKRYKDDQLAKVIKSQSRKVYSPAQAEADAATLTDFYRANSRYAARITPKIIHRSDNRVDLVFEIQEGRITEIHRVSFIGNRAYSDRRLRQVIETKQAGLLHQLISKDSYLAERLTQDKQKLKDFYLSRGYIDFQVLDVTSSMARNRNSFFLTFKVQEGLSYRFGKITAASEVHGLDAKDFQAALRIKPGQTYSPTIVQYNVERLENLALAKGLNFIRVEPRVARNDRNQTLDIAFTLVKGPRLFVQRIDIQGNNTTLDRVIRRQFHTVEGDPFNPRAIRAASDRIKALGFFSDVQVTTKPGTAKDQVIIDTNVTEQPTGSLSFGVSYGVDAGAGVALSFSESNFLGRGQSLKASINSGVDNATSSITFVEPALLGRDLQFSFGAQYATSSYNNNYYDTKTISVTPGIEFPISENGRLGLHYRIAQDKMSNVDNGVATPSILTNEVGTKLTSIIGYRYSYDTRRTGLNPNAGVLLSFGQDFAGVGGDNRYIRTSAAAKAEKKVAREEVTLRASLEGGVLTMLKGDSRAVDRYFGTGKILGFKANGIGPRDLNATNQDALGGNMFAVARVEAEFPLGLPTEYGIRGGVFFNAGSVWGLDNTYGQTIDTSMHLRSAIGFSIFWDTPIGPLRFNFSRALQKQSYDQVRNFDLMISTQF